MSSSVYKIQFQKGMGLPEFIDRFGLETQCEEHLFQLKWGHQFVCSKCGSMSCSSYRRNNRLYYQCSNCRYQESLTAGTIFHRTHLKLRTWFLGIFLISEAKTSLSSLELHRLLHINHKTAWLMLQKVMQVMTHAEECSKLSGRIEMDDGYLGGFNTENRARGAASKTPFIAAVQTVEDEIKKTKRPWFIKLAPVETFSVEEVTKWSKQYLTQGSHVVSDSRSSFTGVEPHCSHEVHVTSQMNEEEKTVHFKWVNTILANVKTGLVGTFHSSKWNRYGFRYLGAIVYRFNHRFSLDTLFLDLLNLAVQAPPENRHSIIISP